MLAIAPALRAQQEFFTAEDVIKYTPDWKGERFPDGRPKVPDDILDRMKNVTLEEAWAMLQGAASITSMRMAGSPSIPTRCWWAER